MLTPRLAAAGFPAVHAMLREPFRAISPLERDLLSSSSANDAKEVSAAVC